MRATKTRAGVVGWKESVEPPVCTVPLEVVEDCIRTCDPKWAGELSCGQPLDPTHCQGLLRMPALSAPCTAVCAANAWSQVACSPALARYSFNEASDPNAAYHLDEAGRSAMLFVLPLAVGQKDFANDAVASFKSAADGYRGSIPVIVRGGPTTAALLAACLGSNITAGLDAAASIQANLIIAARIRKAFQGDERTLVIVR